MRCGNVSLEETPLEELARSLRTGGWTSHLKMEQATTEPSFPMYTLPAEKLLQMSQIQPHEELLAAGALTIYEERLGRAAFVSHQWVGKGHPDPEFKQMRVLQDTLKNLLSGESEVSVDLITEAVYFRSTGLTAAEWQEKPLFLWYDYFSCPQLEEKGDACSNHLQMAIDSIPVYVSRCDFFMALCPVLSSPDGTETFSDYTWGDRGWCRVEQLVRDLTVNQGSWILVKSAMHQELKVSQLSSSSPGEGRFTVEKDCARVAVVLQSILQKKLIMCLAAGDLVQYRFLLNQQTAFLRNLPVEKVQSLVPGECQGVLEDFLRQNGFRKALDRDAAGWSPLCYASMNGDPNLIQALLEAKASPNDLTQKPRSEVNMDKNTSVLAICAKFKNHEAMQVLLNAKAEVNTKAVHTPLGMSCLVNDPQGVRLLCDARADPHKKNPFGDHALNMAAASGASAAVEALLKDPKDFDLSFTLHNAVMLQGGSSQVVSALIAAGCDVDAPYLQPIMSLVGIVHRVKGLQYRFQKPTMMRRMAYHSRGATPLMLAIICGNFEAAATLLAERARTDLRNFRGKTALDLAHELSVPDYLMDALNGVSCRKCWSIVSAANSKSLNPVIPSEGSIGARSMKSWHF